MHAAERHARRRGLAFTAAIVCVLLAGVVVGRATGIRSTTTGITPVASAAPAGDASHTQDGAVATAIADMRVVAEGLLLLDPPARAAELRRISAPAAHERLAASLLPPLGAVDRGRQEATAANRGSRALLRAVPVAYHVDSYSPAAATVRLWTVSVVVLESLGGPTESWTTTTVGVTWVDDGWRLDSLASGDGPTPAGTAHTTPQQLTLDTLSDFGGIDYVAR